MRQADDIVDVLTLAPANQSLPTESRIAADDHPHPGPGLTQARNDQLDHLLRVPGAVNAIPAQHTGQHGLATEDVERQVAMAVVPQGGLATAFERAIRRSTC